MNRRDILKTMAVEAAADDAYRIVNEYPQNRPEATERPETMDDTELALKIAPRATEPAEIVPPIGCGRCESRWGGVNTSYCGGCHRTFTGLTAFDAHRTGSFAKGDRACAEPESVGLVLNGRDYPCWGFPAGDNPWATHPGAHRADNRRSAMTDQPDIRETLARRLFEHEYRKSKLWTWEQESRNPGCRDYWLEAADAILAAPGIAVVELPEPDRNGWYATGDTFVVTQGNLVAYDRRSVPPVYARTLAAALLAAARKAEEGK